MVLRESTYISNQLAENAERQTRLIQNVGKAMINHNNNNNNNNNDNNKEYLSDLAYTNM